MHRSLLAAAISGLTLIVGIAAASTTPGAFLNEAYSAGSNIIRGEIGRVQDPATLALFCTGIGVLIYLRLRRSV